MFVLVLTPPGLTETGTAKLTSLYLGLIQPVFQIVPNLQDRGL